jgi:hypothetical protein
VVPRGECRRAHVARAGRCVPVGVRLDRAEVVPAEQRLYRIDIRQRVRAARDAPLGRGLHR